MLKCLSDDEEEIEMRDIEDEDDMQPSRCIESSSNRR